MGIFERGSGFGGDRGNRGGRDSRGFGGKGSFGRSPGGFGGGAGRGFGRPQMFKATCDSCGGTAEVPFRPTGEKPVYCSACFNKEGGGKFSQHDRRESGQRDFGDNRPSFGGEKRMFPATCAKCGAACEVPFRPSGDKPAYCRDCFSQIGGRGPKSGAKPGSGSGLSSDPYRAQFAALHEKLDLILDALYYDEEEGAEEAAAVNETKGSADKNKKADKKAAKQAEAQVPAADPSVSDKTVATAADASGAESSKGGDKKAAKKEAGKKPAEKDGKKSKSKKK